MHFKGTLRLINPSDVAESFGDWSIVPAVCWVVPYDWNRWQYWRNQNGIYFPMPFLVQDRMQFYVRQNYIETRVNNTCISRWQDWRKRIDEKRIANLPPATGCFLKIKSSIIEEFATVSKSNYCWFCEIKGYRRKHSFGEFEKINCYDFLGASNLILQ